MIYKIDFEQRVDMYRTLDTYTIKLSQPPHWHTVEIFDRLLEEHHLLADFRECFDKLADGKFEFTTSCSYKTYKTFFLILYQAFGPFTAEVSFNEDYPPEGCVYNTTVNFEVDKDGNYAFALVNVLSAWGTGEPSEEYRTRRLNPAPPFAPNCKEAGHIANWRRS